MRTILVVDDEPAITGLVEQILTRRDFRVLAAHSSDVACELATRERVDLIVSDVHMPGLSGPDLLAFLRGRGITVPVVFISGDLAPRTVERSLNVPDAAFLPKPFTPGELLASVWSSLRQG